MDGQKGTRCAAIAPDRLPLVELSSAQIEKIVAAVPGGGANVADIYPLAPLQEGILFHYLLGHRDDAYIALTLLEFQARAQLDTFVCALETVINRHDILRSSVLWEDLPQPVQVVHRRVILPVEEVALEANIEPSAEIGKWMQRARQRMDLREAPLLRLEAAADPIHGHWYALLRFHHIVCDHVSLAILCEELTACLEGRESPSLETMPFRNHVARCIAWGRTHDASGYFRKRLADIVEPSAPFGLLDVHGDGSEVDEARRSIEAGLALRMGAQARRLRVTPATLFHVAWGIVVASTSGRSSVVYGTVLFGRLQTPGKPREKFGMFLNTLPLRLSLEGLTTQDLVQHCQKELYELVNYELCSLSLAQRCSGVDGSTPLFTTLLNYRHKDGTRDSWAWAGVTGARQLAGTDRNGYPITLAVDDLGDRFDLTMQTDRRINPERMVDYVCTAMHSLVQALEQAPQTPALALSVLPESEREEVIEGFNATAVIYPQDKLLHGLFEEQVGRTPDAVAVVYEGQSLSYAELNARANQLARYLKAQGVGPERTVGICVERSLEMVVGLLGILKSGGAYVPLDPSYPAERLQYMLSDAAPRVLLTQERLRERLPQTDARVIALDEHWSEIARRGAQNLDEPGLTAHHLAYVIYTSGSTGRPKGAMNEHRAVVNRIQWMQDAYRMSPEDRVLQKTPFSFDVSVWEFFWTLMSGARLIVARPDGHKDPAYLRKLIEESGVTRLHFVPSMLQSFLDQYQPGECASLRHIVCSGEELSASLQSRCLASLPQVQLSNLYGPTEAAVDVTAWECRREDVGPRVPIGRPISNLRMYVLDAHLQPVPLGVPAELYIGGVGVGRGYLNRPDLTAERFTRDPFSTAPQARMYKTGDLGRWRADGSIEYLGRNDHQVKIRGFRIELGEIESRLVQNPQVKEAVVLAREDVPGEKRLVAYIVPRRISEPGESSGPGDVSGPDAMLSAERTLSAEVLRTHLKPLLPDHMVPSAFVLLEYFPLSPNGKLDRKALPAPERGAHASREYETPQGEVEEILAVIWAEVLKTERIGRNDNFFDLGGHSLLGIKLITRVAESLALRPPVVTIFHYPTVRQMADFFQTLLSQDLKPPGLQDRDGEAGII
jgi:amino acid adenylation domain-containing protein